MQKMRDTIVPLSTIHHHKAGQYPVIQPEHHIAGKQKDQRQVHAKQLKGVGGQPEHISK